MGFSDSQHLRKTVAGACMFLAPLLFVVSAVVSPKLETTAGKQLSVATQHVDRYYIANLLGMIGLILVVPAVLGLMHMIRERRPAYGAVDWWVALFFAAGVVCLNIAFPAGVLALAIVGSALMLVGLGSVGLMVLRESDADWEHTPDYRGLRPAAGLS